jgi:hypothetical protein
MLTEREIEQAHPEAFDFAFGNLPSAKGAEFGRHLTSCRYCRAVVDEYSEIGGIIKMFPPHVEPSADLEDRTVAAMAAALAERKERAGHRSDAEDQAVTKLYPVPGRQPPAEPEAQIQPRQQLGPPAGSQDRSTAARLPVWRRYRGRFTALAAAAAAIVIAAIVVPLSLGSSEVTTAQGTVAIPLHATTAAKVLGAGSATARATARQVGESWTFELVVNGLKPLNGNDVYVCWWVGPGNTKAHPVLATGGSFVVGDSGSATVTMTTGVDPHQFRTMEITAESPGNGALRGAVLLTSQT